MDIPIEYLFSIASIVVFESLLGSHAELSATVKERLAWMITSDRSAKL